MSTLNFPDPAVTQTYTEAGITWTWNATMGVWSAASLPALDEILLVDGSNASTGQQEFQGGIVVPGSSISSDTKATPDTEIYVNEGDPVGCSVTLNKTTDGGNQSQGLGVYYLDATTDHNKRYINILSQISAAASSTQDVQGFDAAITPQNTAGKVIAFRCNFNNTSNTGSGGAYQIYAQGDAPSYFAGNVGIGTDNAPSALTVDGGSIRQTNLAGAGNRAVYSGASGVLTNSSSDGTLKTNISSLGSQVEIVKQLNPVSYNWIDTKERGAQPEIGFIAQEVETLVPEVVGTNFDGTLSVDYPKLTATLTKALQEALERIEALEAAAGGGTTTTRKRKS